MDEKDQDLVIPVIREEVRVDAVPVVTGGVRVTKRVASHDELIEQELRRSHVEVKRVKTDRVVNGPQSPQRVGNTLIIPVVSEVLKIEKQWVVTEEIHITEVLQTETVQNKVTVNTEEAKIERIDAAGNVVTEVAEPAQLPQAGALQVEEEPAGPASILSRAAAAGATADRDRPRSILKTRRNKS